MFSDFKNKIIVRGHQASRSMIDFLVKNNGFYNSWEENTLEKNRKLNDLGVYTGLVSPYNLYGLKYNFDFSTWVKFEISDKFKDWNIEIEKNKIISY